MKTCLFCDTSWSPRECNATFLLRNSCFANENIVLFHLCFFYPPAPRHDVLFDPTFFPLVFSKNHRLHSCWNDTIRVISKNSIDCRHCQSVISYMKRLHQFYFILFVHFNSYETAIVRFQANFFCQIWPVSHFLWAWLQ